MRRVAIIFFVLAFVALSIFCFASSEVQIRVATLIPHREFQSRNLREAAIENFLFLWTREHRRYRDALLTQAVLRARWAGAVTVVLWAALFLVAPPVRH